MQVTIRGKNVEVTPKVQDYVEKKVGKLDRFLPTISEAHMELAAEKTRSAQDSQVAQLTIRSQGTILRVEERHQDIFAAIDAVLDKMYRKIGRYKGKRQDRSRAGAEEIAGEELPIEAPAEDLDEEPAGQIVRIKNFRMVSINAEEAIEQMELLGHDFYVFFNADVGQINVYRVEITGYDMVHFDAFDHMVSGDHIRYVKAPFSHDASGGGTPPIPEPGTLALLGGGLAGLAMRRRRST